MKRVTAILIIMSMLLSTFGFTTAFADESEPCQGMDELVIEMDSKYGAGFFYIEDIAYPDGEGGYVAFPLEEKFPAPFGGLHESPKMGLQSSDGIFRGLEFGFYRTDETKPYYSSDYIFEGVYINNEKVQNVEEGSQKQIFNGCEVVETRLDEGYCKLVVSKPAEVTGTMTVDFRFKEKGEEQPVMHTVSFDTDGGNKIEAVQVEHDTVLTKPTDPVKEGYKFLGWQLGENPYDFSTPVTSDIELKAKWEKKVPEVPQTPSYPAVSTGNQIPKEVKDAQDASKQVIADAVNKESFSGDELKKAEDIKKSAEEKIGKATTLEEIKAIEKETLSKIDALWTMEEIELKGKVEAVNNDSFIAKTKTIKTKNGKKAIKLTWNKPEGLDFDGFEIYRSLKKGKFGSTPFRTENGTKFYYVNTKGLKADKTYYYKVKAFKIINGEKVFTNWSSKTWKKLS